MRHTGCVSSLSGNKSIHTFPSKETHFFSLCQISLLLLSYDISLRISWEFAFQEKWIRIMASTTTLAEGVNFPIKTLLLAQYKIPGYGENKKNYYELSKS